MNPESKTYINVLIFTVIALFIISGATFLILTANKLDIIMRQPPGETYTYFMMIMDRIIALLTVVVIVPISVYQWLSHNKNTVDKITSAASVLIIAAFLGTFFSGELHFYEKYKDGELNKSVMFCKPSVETKIFDKILIKNGITPPNYLCR